MPMPPATPPTCGWVACTPLSITATRTGRGDVIRCVARDLAEAHLRAAARRGTGRSRTAARTPPSVRPAPRTALIDDARAVEHDDVIGGHRHLAPMRDQDGRAAAHHRARAFDDLALRDRIERRGRLVHDEHRRIGQKGARQRDALPLAGRHRQAALADHRRVSLRQGPG